MTNPYSDTIVAPATTPGTGAISIVRMSGPECFAIADKVVQLKSGTISYAAGYTIHFGEVYSVIPSAAEGSLLDEVLVSIFRAPHSYTGEDSVEISTHASAYIVQELIRLLIEAGARLAEPGEFTRRAFLNGKMDLAQAEAVADVIASTSAGAHRVAMNQLKGSVSSQLASLREQLLEMASLLELELDFSEEDVEFAGREKLLGLVSATHEHVSRLAASFRQGNLIKNGVPVAIVGAVNAGKSTLLNALLGEDRALVSDMAGTTRDTIEECLHLGGILFRFIDTAGIRDDASDDVERMGIDRTWQKLSQAQVVLCVVDVTAPDYAQQAALLLSRLDLENQKAFLLANKSDKVSAPVLQERMSALSALGVAALPIAAKSGTGLDTLRSALADAEKDLVPNASSTFITNERHYAALVDAASALADVERALKSNIPTDLVAEDLRRGIAAINAILGTDLLDSEVILNRIFAKHCIGK